MMDEPLIFPVGHLLGVPSFEGGAPATSQVRIGWELYDLQDVAEISAWALAHGLPEGADMAPWTRSAAVGAARAAGIAEAAARIEKLVARGLVIEFEPGSDDAVDFAKACRIRSLFLGLGNTCDEPDLFGIGLPGSPPIVRVPAITYEIWKWGHACDSVWHACGILAQAGAGGAGVPADPADVLTDCLPRLQVLISHGAAYLDEARDEWDQQRADDAADPLEPAV